MSDNSSNKTISTQIPFNIPQAPTLEQQAQGAPEAAVETPGNLYAIEGVEGVGTRDYAKMDHFNESNGRSGILGTARKPTGAPAARLSPDSRVTVGGIEMQLQHAEAAGLVRFVNGDYVEAGAEQQDAIVNEPTPQEQQEKAEEAAKVGFSQDVEAFLGETVGKINPSIQTNIIESALAVAFSPDVEFAVDKQNLAGTAADHGIDGGKLQEALRYAEVGFRTQASDALKKAGVAPEDAAGFLEWAMANRKAEFMAAVRQHIYGRDPTGYAAVAKAYLRGTVPAEQTLQQHNIKVRTLPNGQRLVTVPGKPEVPVEVAARLEWV